MPKRSNEFQKLIHLIYQQLEDPATVTESKLLPNRVTKRLREVDVVMEVRCARTTLLVAVECRDHKKRQDVELIEQVKTKLENLGIHKVVLVSSSGFTPQARELAQREGYDTLTLEEAVKVDWNEGIRKLEQLFLGLAHPTLRTWALTLEHASEEPIPTMQDFGRDPVVYNPDGSVRSALSQFFNEVAHHALAEKSILEHADPGTQIPVIFDGEFGREYYMVDRSGRKRVVRHIRLEGTADVPDQIPVKLKHRMFGGAHVAYGTIDHPVGQGLITMVQEVRGKSSGAIRLPGRLPGVEKETTRIGPLHLPPEPPG